MASFSIVIEQKDFVAAIVAILYRGVPSHEVKTIDASPNKVFTHVFQLPPIFKDLSIANVPNIIRTIRASFFFHVITVAVEDHTYIRPAVRTGYDCWVGTRDGMECIGVLTRICGDTKLSVCLAIRYGWQGCGVIKEVGLIVMPTRNLDVSGSKDTDPSSFGRLYTDLYRTIVDQIPREKHWAVQLTFEPTNFPSRTIAESMFCLEDCLDTMGYVIEWTETEVEKMRELERELMEHEEKMRALRSQPK